MRQGPRVTLIVTTIVAAASATWLPPAAVHAAKVTVTVVRGTAVTTCGPFGTATGGNVTIPSCGNVTITPRPGTVAAEVAALTGTSQNQVVIRNTLITNNAASATVTIEGSHTFANVDVNAARAYGVGLSANFSRKVSTTTVLACNNQIKKAGFYAYTKGSQTFEDKIGSGVGTGVDLSYNVPCSGSTTQNTIPIPAPRAQESGTADPLGPTRECADLVNGGVCQLGETLRTVLTVTLTQTGDQVTIPSGDHTVAGPADDAGISPGVNAVLASLSGALLLLQNSPVARVNVFDDGFLTLYLRCNASFRCEKVDRTSLQFGPDGAIPKSVQLKDVNQDGFKDLVMSVRQRETGIACGDTTATLTGMATFDGLEDPLEFNATVGFYTGPGCE